ncbi:MAG: hypothetical protein DWQ44_07220 [Bacteroidetes bacterium]|nr:MAG: hypothetical protein DWQ33_12465 [Bacteroidota bacterium]REJ99806.1 MAG: hypothetical protein DWQ39_12840 [Bacteroidota bacterium]REK34179.1 MAG: hypothetical protein DWQ44_07220 [Bacteroidota bacterium]REK50509.1 MAG: hypothetical protein DWQ48_04130 [Bacteroidota bacterium]
MKKLILTVALASAAAFVNAQDMMSKRGTPILPEAGDWSIGFDGTPILRYFGNLMTDGNNNNTNAAYQQQNTIVGKMMKDENTAMRGKIRLGFGSSTVENLVDQDGSTSTPPATVVDSWKASGTDITLGAGLQKYRGKGRLKGFYGAEAEIMLGSGKHTYEYGNAFSSSNTTPTSTDWWSTPIGGMWPSGPVGGRITEEKDGSTFGFGVRGFIGAEYFFAPKMSIGAEYGWGIGITSMGEGEITSEGWTGTAVQTNTSKTGKSSSFGADVDNAGGAIYLSLYF